MNKYDHLFNTDITKMFCELRCKDGNTFVSLVLIKDRVALYKDITEEFGKSPEYLDLTRFTIETVKLSLIDLDVQVHSKYSIESKIEIMNCMKYLQLPDFIITEYVDRVIFSSFKGGKLSIQLAHLEMQKGIQINYPDTTGIQRLIAPISLDMREYKFYFEDLPKLLENYQSLDDAYDRISAQIIKELKAGTIDVSNFMGYEHSYYTPDLIYSPYKPIVVKWINENYNIDDDTSYSNLCHHLNVANSPFSYGFKKHIKST